MPYRLREQTPRSGEKSKPQVHALLCSQIYQVRAPYFCKPILAQPGDHQTTREQTTKGLSSNGWLNAYSVICFSTERSRALVSKKVRSIALVCESISRDAQGYEQNDDNSSRIIILLFAVKAVGCRRLAGSMFRS